MASERSAGRRVGALCTVRLTLLVALLLQGSASADQWVTYTTQDGMAGSKFHDLLVASDGSLWAASLDGGVSRYDGEGWESFTVADGLASAVAQRLVEAADGSIWVTGVYPLAAGVSQFRNGVWTGYNAQNGLASVEAHDMIAASDGSVWVATRSGVSRHSHGTWQSFTREDGLVNNIALSLAEDTTGAIWIGTSDGVSRYTGGSWQAFGKGDGLHGSYSYYVAALSDGSVWVCSIDRSGRSGLSRYDGTTWQSFTADVLPETLTPIVEGVEGSWVTSIVEGVEGSVWVGTTGGVARYDGDGWEQFSSEEGLRGRIVPLPGGLLQASDGTIWVATDGEEEQGDGLGGVSRFDGTSWRSFSAGDGLASNIVYAIAEGIDGSIWVGSSGGVSQFVGGWKAYGIDDGLGDEWVFGLHQVVDGSVWAVHKEGVSRFDGSEWTGFTDESGLPAGAVVDVLVAADGSFWIAAEGGVGRYADGRWDTYPLADVSAGGEIGGPLTGDPYDCLLECPEGVIWLATTRGLGRFADGDWQVTTTDDGLVGNRVNDLMCARDASVWVTTNEGVGRFDGRDWESWSPDDGLPGFQAFMIVEGADGAIWVGMSPGVSRFDGSDWFSYSREDGLGALLVLDLLAASDGSIWAIPLEGERGTLWAKGAGVSRFVEETWKHFDAVDGLSSDNTIYVGETSDGMIWVGGFEGLDRYDGNQWRNFTTRDGLAGNIAVTLMESGQGVLWAGTFGGISRFDGDAWQSFTQEDGIGGSIVTALLEAADGTLWVGTEQGVAQLVFPSATLAQTSIPRPPPSPFGSPNFYFEVTGVEVGTKRRAPISYALTPAGEEPSEQDWCFFSVVNGFEVSGMTNGEWTFHVRARDRYGKIDPTPAVTTFTVDVTPPTVLITEPRNGDSVSGTVTVLGAAFDNSATADLRSYDLDVAAGRSAERIPEEAWTPLVRGASQPVEGGSLAAWNTSGFQGDYVLRLRAVDDLGHSSEYSIAVRVVAAIGEVDRSNGGYLTDESGTVELVVPPGAMDRTRQVALVVLVAGDVEAPPGDGLRFTGQAYAIEPLGVVLGKPGTLTIGLAPATLQAAAAGETIAAYFRPDDAAEWERLGGTLEAEAGLLRLPLHRLGQVALFEDPSVLEGEGSMRELTAQPRAFNPRATAGREHTTISFTLLAPHTVTVRILDWNGQVERELVSERDLNAGRAAFLWDGRDHDGDTAHSGLYTVAVDVGDRTFTEKVAVVTGLARMDASYPNPFNASTVIRYQLTADSPVRVQVYNLAGQLVRTLVDGSREPGLYRAVWDGTDDRGASVSTGLYFVRLQAGSMTEVGKMMLTE